MIDPTTKPEVYTHVERGVGFVVLNRPDKRNALTPAMLRLAIDAVADLFRPSPREGAGGGLPTDVRAIVLCGEGSTFCSGFDMKLVHEDRDALPTLLASLSEFVRLLRRLPVPVVIAAHGGAVAGGCALLGGGDVVIVDSAARLGYPVVLLGISPAVSSPTLLASMHAGAARERLLDPELIDGRRAVEVGLAHICVDIREDVIPRATRIAREFAAKPAHALAATKMLLNDIDGSDDDSPFNRGLAASLALSGAPDQRRRVAALWSKPAPAAVKQT